jgi:hypothetical protein
MNDETKVYMRKCIVRSTRFLRDFVCLIHVDVHLLEIQNCSCNGHDNLYCAGMDYELFVLVFN